jgi:hypothetical protein
MAKAAAHHDKAFRDHITEFYKKVRATAVIRAATWAGGEVADLAEMIGCSRNDGHDWSRRGAFPARIALLLIRLEGFPLGLKDMRPDLDWSQYKARRCPHCDRQINPPNTRDGCSSSKRYSPKRTPTQSRKSSPKTKAAPVNSHL